MSSSMANKWTLFDKVLELKRYTMVVEHIPSNCIIADLGCGSQNLLRCVASKIITGYGIDTKSKSFEPENEKIIFIKGDLNDYVPLANESVHVVTSLAIIEHLNRPDTFVNEAFRILKPNGKFILTTPSPKAKPVLEFLAYKLKIISEADIKDHKQYFSCEKITSLLLKAGFTNISIKPFQMGFNMLIIAKKERIFH